MSENETRHDRYGTLVRGKRIIHSTLRRDWRCGECGHRLVTLYDPDVGMATVCGKNRAHDPDHFVTGKAWDYAQAQRQLENARASDILAHLPADVQASITE